MFERKNPWRVPLATWRIAPDDWTLRDFTIRKTERFVVSFRRSEAFPSAEMLIGVSSILGAERLLEHPGQSGMAVSYNKVFKEDH